MRLLLLLCYVFTEKEFFLHGIEVVFYTGLLYKPGDILPRVESELPTDIS